MAKKKSVSTQLNEIKLLDAEEENLDFPSICRFIRKTFNATQEEMAQKLNVSLSTYTYWEYGKHVPKSWQALNLCILYLNAKKNSGQPDSENTFQNSQQNAA